MELEKVLTLHSIFFFSPSCVFRVNLGYGICQLRLFAKILRLPKKILASNWSSTFVFFVQIKSIPLAAAKPQVFLFDFVLLRRVLPGKREENIIEKSLGGEYVDFP